MADDDKNNPIISSVLTGTLVFGDETKRQEKRERIGRLRKRLEQVRDTQPELGPLVGILKGMLELMADEL